MKYTTNSQRRMFTHYDVDAINHMEQKFTPPHTHTPGVSMDLFDRIDDPLDDCIGRQWICFAVHRLSQPKNLHQLTDALARETVLTGDETEQSPFQVVPVVHFRGSVPWTKKACNWPPVHFWTVLRPPSPTIGAHWARFHFCGEGKLESPLPIPY